MATTPKKKRRQLALAELALDVAQSFAVIHPGSEGEIRTKYDLTEADMEKVKAQLGDRLKKWADRLGYDSPWE